MLLGLISDIHGNLPALEAVLDEIDREAKAVLSELASLGISLEAVRSQHLQPALAAVAKLPKKEVLIAMLLSAMQGPIRGVVYTLNAVLSKFVRVIAAIQDKRKGEGDMSATTTKLSQEELIKAIEGMSVLDLAELVKGLEARFGVTAAAPVAVAAAPAAGRVERRIALSGGP